MEEDPHFVVDEELERGLKLLENIDKTIKDKKAYASETVFLKKFTKYLIFAAGSQAGINVKPRLVSGRDLLEQGKSKIIVENGQPFYLFTEPKLDDKDVAVLDYMRSLIGRRIKLIDDRDFLLRNVVSACNKFGLEFSESYLEKIYYYLYKHLRGLGRLQPLLDDNDVNGIYCYGLDQPVLVDYKEAAKIKTKLIFSNAKEINDIILKLGEKVDVEITVKNPFLNVSFNGLNIHAIYGGELMSPKFIILREKN